jgi:hypothetical protein
LLETGVLLVVPAIVEFPGIGVEVEALAAIPLGLGVDGEFVLIGDERPGVQAEVVFVVLNGDCPALASASVRSSGSSVSSPASERPDHEEGVPR